MATVSDDAARRGDYLVGDVSAGGAMLLHGPSLALGSHVRVNLRIFGVSHVSLSVNGVLVRTDHRASAGGSRQAIKFVNASPYFEDTIQRAVLRALETKCARATLVADDDLRELARLAEDLTLLRRQVRLAFTPLTAIRWLSEPETVTEAIIVPSTIHGQDGPGLLRAVHDDFPSVRRILLARDWTDTRLARHVDGVVIHAGLCGRWTRAQLREALVPTLRTPTRGLSSVPPCI